MSSEKPQNNEITKSTYTIMKAMLPFKIGKNDKICSDFSDKYEPETGEDFNPNNQITDKSYNSPPQSSKKRVGLSAESKKCHSNAKLAKPQSKARGSALKENLIVELTDQINDQFALYKSKINTWKQDFDELLLNKEMFFIDLNNFHCIGVNSVGSHLLTKYKFWTLCNVNLCERKIFNLKQFIVFYQNSNLYSIDHPDFYNDESILIIKEFWGEHEILAELNTIKEFIPEYCPPLNLSESSKDDFDLLLLCDQPKKTIQIHHQPQIVSTNLFPKEINSPEMKCPNVSKVSGVDKSKAKIEFSSVIKSVNEKLNEQISHDKENIESQEVESIKSKSSQILKELSPYGNKSNIKPGTCRDPFSKFKKMFAPKRYDALHIPNEFEETSTILESHSDEFEAERSKGNWKDVNIKKLFHVAQLNYIPKELSVYLSQLPVSVLDSLNKSIGTSKIQLKALSKPELSVDSTVENFTIKSMNNARKVQMEVYSEKGVSIFQNKKPIEFVKENESFEINNPQIIKENRVSVDKNKRDSRISLSKKISSIESNSLTKKNPKLKEKSASVEPKLPTKGIKTNKKANPVSAIGSRGNSPSQDLNTSIASARQSPKKAPKSRKTKGK